jgi:hypothetical protein
LRPGWRCSATVEPDFAVHVHGVELDPVAPPGVGRFHLKFASVPTDSARLVAAAVSLRGILVISGFERPVMRHIERPPAGLHKRRLLGARLIAEVKLPAMIDTLDHPFGPRRRREK